MPNYWERRQAADAYEVYQAAEDVADQIATLYSKSAGYLQKEADQVFNRFRKKYGLTEAEARRLISRLGDPADLPQLQRMLKNAQQTEEVALLRREIESAAFRARLERLQQLQNNIDRIMRQVYQQELRISKNFYIDLANESYYKSIFRLQQRAHAAFSFDHVSQKVIDKVVNSRWSGENYSRRIWKNTQGLARTLKEEMLVNLLTGRTIREASDIVANKFGVGANMARRLVRTESNYVHTQLNFEAYKEAGVEKYLYLATLDLKTSKICRSLDGKIFLVSEQKVGVNCPPMHPWCRSTTIAIINEELLKTMQRSAIDPATGKRIKVPATMKYQEWYDKYVTGKKDEIKERQEEKSQNDRNLDRQQFERYRKYGVEPETYEKYLELKYKNPEEYARLKKRYRIEKAKAEKGYADITRDFLESATSGEGSYTFAQNATEEDKTTAKWLFNKFGGDIYCLGEQSAVGKMPDAIWNDWYWEFKAPTTKNAIDERLRKANSQLLEALIRDGNPSGSRGIVVDITNNQLIRSAAVEEIIHRSIQRRKGNTIVLIKHSDELVKAVEI